MESSLFESAAYWIGVTVIVASTVSVGGFALAMVSNCIANKFSSTWMVALFWIHRKKFYRWCKQNRGDLPELQQNAIDLYAEDK